MLNIITKNITFYSLNLHCLPKYPFRGFQYTKGYKEAVNIVATFLFDHNREVFYMALEEKGG